MHRPPLPPGSIGAPVDRMAIARPEGLRKLKHSSDLIGSRTPRSLTINVRKVRRDRLL